MKLFIDEVSALTTCWINCMAEKINDTVRFAARISKYRKTPRTCARARIFPCLLRLFTFYYLSFNKNSVL